MPVRKISANSSNWIRNLESLAFLPPATKLGQGNIFRSVCQEFCSHPEAVHAGRYGQQAGSTHPTGMHACCEYFFNANVTKRKRLQWKDTTIRSVATGDGHSPEGATHSSQSCHLAAISIVQGDDPG